MYIIIGVHVYSYHCDYGEGVATSDWKPVVLFL